MLLTPVFTPPLDTEIGGERLRVQLVDVKLENGKYSFAFDRFIRWVRLAQKCGIKYFEISHLFSQWGSQVYSENRGRGKRQSKRILVKNLGRFNRICRISKRIYPSQLIKVIRSLGIEKSTFFHISDEPNEDQIESYSWAKAPLLPPARGFSDYRRSLRLQLYEGGIINNRYRAINDIESFIKKASHTRGRIIAAVGAASSAIAFFGIPLSTTRIIGFQLFKYGIEGFYNGALI